MGYIEVRLRDEEIARSRAGLQEVLGGSDDLGTRLQLLGAGGFGKPVGLNVC